MATMKVEIEVEVYCTCGDELTVKRVGDGTLNVEPCQNCLDNKYNEGLDDGLAIVLQVINSREDFSLDDLAKTLPAEWPHGEYEQADEG